MRSAPDEPTRSPALSAQRPNRHGPATPPSTSRRERREAFRKEQGGRPARSSAAKPPAWKSPTFIVTALAIVVALGFIVVLNVKPGSSSSGSLPLGLVRPLSEIPASIPRDGRTVGAPAAKVTIDAWEDFQCTACGHFTETIEPSLVGRFLLSGAVKLTYHDLFVIGPESVDAATAARCADEQGRFWGYHDWLFANQNGENQGWFSRDRLAAMAGQVGLDPAKWNACYDAGTARQAANAEADQGGQLGLKSTPTLMLDGKILKYTTVDELFGQIQAAVDAAGGSSAAPSPSAAPSASAAP